MGYYVNPPDRTKEQFLEAKGYRLPDAPDRHREGDKVAVCLVDNGWMTAAGIAYSPEELRVFSDPQDHRFKTWYMVPITDLAPFISADKIDEAA